MLRRDGSSRHRYTSQAGTRLDLICGTMSRGDGGRSVRLDEAGLGSACRLRFDLPFEPVRL
jgi:hypothetical protein